MDIRKRILDELKHQGKSRYWLGMRVAEAKAANRETVFRYLRGTRDTSGGVIGAMLKVLGLQLELPTATTSASALGKAKIILVRPAKASARRSSR